MEVSALGGIIDTYEKELEEYKKQVFELMKQKMCIRDRLYGILKNNTGG